MHIKYVFVLIDAILFYIGGIYYRKFNKNFTPVHYLQPAILNRLTLI